MTGDGQRKTTALIWILVIAIISGGVAGNSSNWWCPVHCAAPRRHPCPGEDGTPMGQPIPEVAGGLDPSGHCRPQDHGKFLYHFINDDSGGKVCVKCYCFQDSVDLALIDPSCYKVDPRTCTRLRVSEPKTEIMKHVFGKQPGKNSLQMGSSSKEMGTAASETAPHPHPPKRHRGPPPPPIMASNQALHNCMYFGIDCNPSFFLT